MKKFEVVIEYEGSETLYVEAENENEAKNNAIIDFKSKKDKNFNEVKITNSFVNDGWEN